MTQNIINNNCFLQEQQTLKMFNEMGFQIKFNLKFGRDSTCRNTFQKFFKFIFKLWRGKSIIFVLWPALQGPLEVALHVNL